MKIVEKKRVPMTKNITIRLQEDTFKMVQTIAKEYGKSNQLVINKILEKSLKSQNFLIEL